jgi:plastocyanin
MRLASKVVRVFLAAVVLLCIGMAAAASAAPNAGTAAVSIEGFRFIPAAITVEVGDSVRWTNLDSAPHSAKASAGGFDTGALSQNQSASITFSTPGTFAYICGIHGSSMSGTVTVRAPASPTVVPTAPPSAPTPRPSVSTTPRPTVAPTPEPTLAPTPGTSPPTPTTSADTTAPAAVASPTPTSAAPPASLTRAANDGGPGALIVAGAAVIIAGLGGLAWRLRRR